MVDDSAPNGGDPPGDQPIFFFDLGSPYAWLVAEGLGNAMPSAIWQPVCQQDLAPGPLWDGDRGRVVALAAQAGLLAPRWSRDDQPDTREAMLAATWCKSIGRAASFALAAFRQAYNGGRNLADRDTLLIAAAACELHPRAVLQALALESTHTQLDTAAALARLHDVTELPAVKRENELLNIGQLLELVAQL
jgi:2-hydroxychromene-2-carboxylate isomerase